VKKKQPAILEPDADDFCNLIARGIMRLLESSVNRSNPRATDSDRDPETGSLNTPISR
jgi:hypothetical protein